MILRNVPFAGNCNPLSPLGLENAFIKICLEQRLHPLKGPCLVDREMSPENPSFSGSQLHLQADLRLSNTIGKDDRSLSVQNDTWLARLFTSSTFFLPFHWYFFSRQEYISALFLAFFFSSTPPHCHIHRKDAPRTTVDTTVPLVPPWMGSHRKTGFHLP